MYTIKSNQATVRFHSDLSYVSEGFSAEFEAFEPTNREYNHIIFPLISKRNVQSLYTMTKISKITFPQRALGGSSVTMICVCVLTCNVMATMTVEI